jgi:diphosphomevalonate decarboxylase
LTLDQAELRAVTTAAASSSFTKDRLRLNGVEESTDTARFRACVDGVKALASEKKDADAGSVLASKQDWKDWNVYISSYNTFPTAAGLASSAARYAALVAALAELMQAKEEFSGAAHDPGSPRQWFRLPFALWRLCCLAHGLGGNEVARF